MLWDGLLKTIRDHSEVKRFGEQVSSFRLKIRKIRLQETRKYMTSEVTYLY